MTVFDISNEALADFLKLILPIAGILLGLVFTALIYWLETGVSSLTFTRETVSEIFIKYARIILSTLTYITIVSILYVQNLHFLVFISFLIFSIYFTKTTFDYISYYGYLEATFGSKILPPNFSPFRKYLRNLRNAGLKAYPRASLSLILVIFVPLYWLIRGQEFRLPNESLYLSVLAAIILVVLIELVQTITQMLDVQKYINQKSEKSSQENKSNP